MEEIFLQHYELPLHGVEHLEFYFVYFMTRLCVDEEVCVVEEGIDQ